MWKNVVSQKEGYLRTAPNKREAEYIYREALSGKIRSWKG